MDPRYVVEMDGICKSFYGVQVLKDVKLNVAAGEIVALLGENGAGKSTLMNILCGVHKMDKGQIKIDGEPVSIQNPRDAWEKRISIVHQEISLVDTLSIADNVFLGSEIKKKIGTRNNKEMKSRTQEALDSLRMGLRADMLVGGLNVAQQQMVEVAKAVCFNSKVVIFDEPTASLTDAETEALFEQIAILKEKKIAIIYISHRLEEIFRIADRVTVLRDGTYIDTKPTGELTKSQLISMMVGREITNLYGTTGRPKGEREVVLRAENLSNQHFKNVSFELRKGEILGFSGLVGAGRTEVARAIFGVDRLNAGELYLEGERVRFRTPGEAIRKGISLVSEDRKHFGLILTNSVAFNLTLMVTHKFIKHLRVDKKKEQAIIDEYANKLSIKMSGSKQLCMNLSGGNQQKVVISKCLAAGSKIVIFDEPTRGIDVGAKAEIYELITRLAKEEGISIILISSELPEIMNLSSRIAVMHEGELVHIFDDPERVTQEEIMYYATGGE